MGERKREREKEREKDGVGIRDLRRESGGGRKAPHAGETGVDIGERVAEWAESGGSEMRGDLPLWWTRSPEDEVPEVPPQAHEHQALSWAHPLPRPLQDPLAYHPWVSY